MKLFRSKREKEIERLEKELATKLTEAHRVGLGKNYEDLLIEFYTNRIYNLKKGA